MSFLRKLLQVLGFRNSTRPAFYLDTRLADSLTDLAQHEERKPDDVAADLLNFALAQREVIEDSVNRWEQLSQRERQICALICRGFTNRQVATQLRISPSTVKTHISNILRKFDLHSKTELRTVLKDWDLRPWL